MTITFEITLVYGISVPLKCLTKQTKLLKFGQLQTSPDQTSKLQY